jgi:NAD+ diphosphatase
VDSFIPAREPTADHDAAALWFFVGEGGVAIVDEQVDAVAVDPTIDRHFIGAMGRRPVWASDLRAAPEGQPLVDAPLRSLYGQVPDELWAVAGRAVQIVEWARTHRYCGRCATPTEPATEARAMRCPACGLLAFPRLAPAIIVLVERDGGERALLARGSQFPIPMYSCVAGFVEPGETLEAAVHREVREEVGVEIDAVSYVASQPWPFPHSLMVGFTAQWAGGDIVIDDEEIVDAQWYAPDELPTIPPPLSIARRLIDAWVTRQRR